MPRAAPACWMVSFSAEPTPACSAGIVPMRAETAAGMARPPPAPMRSSATAAVARPLDASRVLSRANPPALTANPVTISGRLPIRAPRVAPRVLQAREATAIGMKARPDSVGV